MTKRRLHRFLLCFLAVWLLTGSGKVWAAAKTPCLSKTRMNLLVNGSGTLMLENYSGTVKWKVSDRKILSVKRLGKNKVKVTAAKKGTAIVTATAGKKKYTCRVKAAGKIQKEYGYLALGNSLTYHPTCSFWWTECGMAASSPEKDYVHQVVSGLEKKYTSVKLKVFNLGAWEIMNQSRRSQLRSLDGVLKTNWDLITIHIGDNIRNTYGFERDFRELLQYVKKKNPKAKIIVIGNFWLSTQADKSSEQIKKRTASRLNLDYADLKEIADKKAYQRGMGAVMYDTKGKAHKVTHPGVAVHPNDKGMAYIAKQVLNLL